MAGTSKIILNKIDDSGYPCLVHDLSVNALTFSPLRMVICVFLIYGLYYVEVSSLYTHFLESFYHKYVLNFVKDFLHLSRSLYGFYFSVYVMYHTDWFMDIEECWHPWDKSHFMDCSSPGSCVHGISQARILEWFAIPFFRKSFNPTQGSNLGLLHWWQILYHLSHQGSPWSLCMILLMYYCVQFVSTLLNIFACMFVSDERAKA